MLRDVLRDVVQDGKLRYVRRDEVFKDAKSFLFSVYIECILARSLAAMVLLQEEACILRIALQ